MTKQIFKSILIGLLMGAAFFVMPFFLLKFFLFFLIIGAIMRLLWGGKRRGRGGWGGYQFAFADKIRNMNDEEYNSFKTKMQNRHYGHHQYGCGGYYNNNHGCYNEGSTKTENKTETNTNDQQA